MKKEKVRVGIETGPNKRKTFATIIVLVSSVILLIAAISMLSNYRTEIVERSTAKAEKRTSDVARLVENEMNKKVELAVGVANVLATKENRVLMGDYCRTLDQKESYADLCHYRFYATETSGEKFYDQSWTLIDDSVADASRAHRENHRDVAGYCGFTTIEDEQMSFLTYYAPVEGNGWCNGVCLYFARSSSANFYKAGFESDDSIISCFTTSTGQVISGGSELSSNDLLHELQINIPDSITNSNIEKLLAGEESGCMLVNYKNKECILTVETGGRLANFCVVELFESQKLYESSFNFVQSIIAIVIIFSVIDILFIIAMLIRNYKLKKHFLRLETFDEKLECNNRLGFEKEATKLLNRNPSSHFHIIILELRHYSFLLEEYGEQEVGNLLAFFNQVIKQSLRVEEACGRLANGQFLMLLRANGDKDIVDRLKTLSFIIGQYKGSKQYDISLMYGIYGVEKLEKATVNKMVDYALETIDGHVEANITHANARFYFYNEKLRQIRIQNEQIETRMDSALINGEFQVFYQPKFNLHTSLQDGAEALVRWYDKEHDRYNPPAMFLALFESNGFIVKLDRYVFRKVCEQISYSIANGRKVFPVSVNVSRLTATQQDFVKNYKKIKSELSIPDNLITVEFTESFAFENYDVLKQITKELHNAGFKVSIDDFGQGSSSYRTLKELPMDEIKLDAMFLDKGYSEERDDKVLESMIQLANKLEVKVTQEGVETQEQCNRVRRLGCDVIQGYLYSKPLPLNDYLKFIENSKSHKV